MHTNMINASAKVKKNSLQEYQEDLEDRVDQEHQRDPEVNKAIHNFQGKIKT